MTLKQLEVHRPWKYLCVFDFKVGGWVTEYGNFLTFATVRGASHMVPSAHPDRILELFLSIIFGQDYQTQQIHSLSVSQKEAQDRKKKLRPCLEQRLFIGISKENVPLF